MPSRCVGSPNQNSSGKWGPGRAGVHLAVTAEDKTGYSDQEKDNHSTIPPPPPYPPPPENQPEKTESTLCLAVMHYLATWIKDKQCTKECTK